MTFIAKSHDALERRDVFDSLTQVADLAIVASKQAKELSAQLAEARLVLAMADDVIRKGSWHPNTQHQVAGVRSQIKAVLR